MAATEPASGRYSVSVHGRTDLSAADGQAPGNRQERGRSLAGTDNPGSWLTTAGARRPSEGPVPDVRRKGPVSAAAVLVTGGRPGGDGGLGWA